MPGGFLGALAGIGSGLKKFFGKEEILKAMAGSGGDDPITKMLSGFGAGGLQGLKNKQAEGQQPSLVLPPPPPIAPGSGIPGVKPLEPMRPDQILPPPPRGQNLTPELDDDEQQRMNKMVF